MAGETVTIGGRRLRLTNLDKVLYPETGTTKADVIDYYVRVAPLLMAHAAGRPVTRKRWPDGVGSGGEEKVMTFFEKNLPDSAPDWVNRVTIQHSDHTNDYPVIDGEAVLAWFGQLAALELHVPQWRAGARGERQNPDRFVIDLDPGPGAGLAECVEVAKVARRILRDMDLEPFPVTSGSKGIHLYTGLDGSHDAAQVQKFAKEFASVLVGELPDLVVATQKKTERQGKVLVDWSQNSAAKTTVAPYSLRGRTLPTVAVPRTWRELSSPRLRQLTYDEVLTRMTKREDPMADLAGDARPDRLATYRSMRDAAKTPEPVPSTKAAASDGKSFVIQEHHASRLHWDFRLEHDGVLVSWALPKGPPTDPKKNHLAVQTEDHPLEYGTFEGDIPRGEYGAGHVDIWDAGTYDLEKWRDGQEVIATLHGREGGGLGGSRRFALIRTGENWLIHLMAPKDADDGDSRSGSEASDDEPRTMRSSGAPGFEEPMLATAGSDKDIDDEDDWAFEMKWDGWRVVAACDGDDVVLWSRGGKKLNDLFPEIVEALADHGLSDTLLDGEVVALDRAGRPSFSLLQKRAEHGDAKAPVRYFVFDLLRHDGTGWRNAPHAERRAALTSISFDGPVSVPDAFTGSLEDAIATSRDLKLEGVMAKRTDSRYRSGRRSPSWLKIKHQRDTEVVVIGWRPRSEGARGDLASLLLATPDEDGELHYAGRVGTGFDQRQRADLVRRLSTIERQTPPVDVPRDAARDARWVTPRLVGEVTYTEWTDEGRLRHPSWRGLRHDRTYPKKAGVPATKENA